MCREFQNVQTYVHQQCEEYIHWTTFVYIKVWPCWWETTQLSPFLTEFAFILLWRGAAVPCRGKLLHGSIIKNMTVNLPAGNISYIFLEPHSHLPNGKIWLRNVFIQGCRCQVCMTSKAICLRDVLGIKSQSPLILRDSLYFLSPNY